MAQLLLLLQVALLERPHLFWLRAWLGAGGLDLLLLAALVMVPLQPFSVPSAPFDGGAGGVPVIGFMCTALLPE